MLKTQMLSKSFQVFVLGLILCSCNPFTKDYSTLNAFDSNGHVQVVIENAKGDLNDFEYDTKEMKYTERGVLELPHPMNNGFIPSTLHASEGPLDVFVLSKDLAQGETLSTKPVGVLKYKIGNNLHYKIVVVPVMPELIVKPIKDFEEFSSGNLKIRKTISNWILQTYNDENIQLLGWYDEEEALSVIRDKEVKA